MRRTRVAFAAVGAFAVLSGCAAAQRIQPAPDYEIARRAAVYSLQDETAPSPSDIQVIEPLEPIASPLKIDEWQSDKSCNGAKGKGYCDNCLGIDFGGWTQFGYTNKSTGLVNSHPDRVNLHQQWLYAEKKADGSCGWGWGFRGDVLYGVDAQNTQAYGSNPGNWDFLNGFDHGIYGWAIPEAFVEVANGDLSVKAGKFGTLIGYEYIAAPNNFFFSHDFGFNNSEPFTHTGFLAKYGASDRLEVYGGWTLGWDAGFDRYRDGSSFLGGFSYDLTDNVNFTYITTFGNFGWRGEGYNHSLVFDVTLTENLNYVLQSDLVATDGTWDVEADVFAKGVANDDININQYLLYSLNDCWGVGARGEWWKRDGHSLYEVTAGVNWKPHTNFVMRPEIRYQWGHEGTFEKFDVFEGKQWIFGIDAIVTY